MKSASVIAKAAPAGKGVASWENGQLTGDAAILDAAKDVERVQPVAGRGATKPDWADPLDVGEALRIGAQRVYGAPVEVITTGDPVPAMVEAGQSNGTGTEPIF